MHLSLYLYLFLHLIVSTLTYSIPDPKVEILNPRGIRISIPHENGIALVAFHFNVDDPIRLNQPGQYSADITEPTNGRWIYDTTQTIIDSSNKINYWMHVQYGNYAYRKLGRALPSAEPVDPSDPGTTPIPITPLLEPSTDTTDCEPSQTTVDRKTVCKGQLIFQDDFNTLNSTIWQREARLPIDDGEFVSFQSREENCYTSDGELHIQPGLLSQVPGFNEAKIRNGKLDLGDECTAVVDIAQECSRQSLYQVILPPVVSARIRTKNFFSFKYGKVEVRAKLPKGDWLFPLILLEPVESYYGFTNYESGQMRVAFSRGNDVLEDRDGNDISGYLISGGVVLSKSATLRDILLKGIIRRSHLGDDYHIYSLTWTKDYISVEVDGNEYASFRGNFARLHDTHNLKHAKRWETGSLMAPFDREFYLTLGVSAGGHSDFPDGSINGPKRRLKPWKNLYPKAELEFWNDRTNWFSTWNGQNAALHVDYVKVYAL